MKIVKKESPKVKSLETTASIQNLIVPSLSLGYQRSPYIQKPLDFLNDLESLDITSDNIAKVMQVCKKLYQRDFTCGAALDALVNFCTSDLTIEPTGNKKFDDIVKLFSENMNFGSGDDRGIYHFCQRFALSWFIYGNVFPMKSYQLFDLGARRVSVPIRIILLNPINIVLETANTQFGPKNLYYKIDDDLVQILKSDGRKNKLKRNIPIKLRNQIKKLPARSPIQEVYAIPLNRLLTDHIKRKALDFDDWGVPYLTRAFRPLSTLNKLIRLDEATLDGLINQFTIFKIGSDEFPADSTRLSAFANLIKARGAPEPNQHIVWQHDITVESVGPDGKILSFENRFNQAMDAIKIALGISDILLTGQKPTGDVYATFLNMLENLVHARKTISIYLQNVLMQIADENNIILKEYPVISWERSNLTNEAEIKNLILSFYDRGLLDPVTAIEESGRDSISIIEKKKKQREDGTEELFKPPKLPFDGGNDNPTDQDGRPEDGDTEKKEEKEDKTEFEATANLVRVTRKQIFDNYFVSAVDYLNRKYSLSKDKDVSNISGYLFSRYEQIRRHVLDSNDIENIQGISHLCKRAIDESYAKILGAKDVGIAIQLLNSEKDNLWEALEYIRSEGESIG